MDFPGGFEPSLAYRGFVQMVEEVFSCCLCAVDKKASWKNRKDPARHFISNWRTGVTFGALYLAPFVPFDVH